MLRLTAVLERRRFTDSNDARFTGSNLGGEQPCSVPGEGPEAGTLPSTKTVDSR